MNNYADVILLFSIFPIIATGVLKGFDPLLNLVLDGTTEYLRGENKRTCLYLTSDKIFNSNVILQILTIHLSYPMILDR